MHVLSSPQDGLTLTLVEQQSKEALTGNELRSKAKREENQGDYLSLMMEAHVEA